MATCPQHDQASAVPRCPRAPLWTELEFTLVEQGMFRPDLARNMGAPRFKCPDHRPDRVANLRAIDVLPLKFGSDSSKIGFDWLPPRENDVAPGPEPE